MATPRTTARRRSRIPAVVAAATLALASLGTAAHAAAPTVSSVSAAVPGGETVAVVDADATDDTLSLFRYLRDQESGGILFGQQHATDEAISSSVTGPDGLPLKSDVHDVTGDLPGIFGFDTLALKGDEKPGSHENTDEENALALAEQFVRADTLGAVVTLSAHMPNFVTGNDFYDTSGRVVSHILPGGDKNADYREYLDLVALAATSAERTDGSLVPVVFRPFHENTGSWFWWGAAHATTGEYKEIFRYTVEYLRDVKGVHNLLYSFSPNGSFDGDPARYLETYPGDQWVDVLGYDNYENSNAAEDSSAYVATVVTDLEMVVDLARERGKIPAFTEFGRNGDRTIKPSGNKSLHYYTELLQGLRASEKAGSVAWMLTWANFGSGQIYVPYAGHEMASDFQALYDDPGSVFASQTGDPYASPATPGTQEPFLRIVSPADGSRVTTATTTVRAKVTAAPGVDSVTFTATGFDPLTLTQDADGYWSGTWEIGEDALTNRTVAATVTATGGGHDLSAAVSLILGTAPELPVGTVDDFEGYGDDVALRAAYTVTNATSSALTLAEHGDGNAARLSYDFPDSRTGYLGFGKSYAPTQNWSGFGQLDVWIDPDGSGHKLVIQVQAGGVTFEAYPSLAGDQPYLAEIPWTEFAPAPWDTANAGATLTWERLAKVSQFFVYMNDAGGSAPLTGSILVDDIKASGEGEYVDPEPSAEPIEVDDFESYADEAAFDAAWGNRGKTDLISLSTDAGEGEQALSFAYDNANGGWQDVARWLGGEDWSGRDALSLRVKGDGSNNQLAIQVGNGSGGYWLAQVPLTDASWHTVEIPFSSFAPSWPADLTDPLDDAQLGVVNELVLASNSSSGSGTFGVDDLRVVGGDAEPEVPDGTPEVLDTFESYGSTTDLRAAWNNIAEQAWGDGWQLSLAPGEGSGGSKAGEFTYDFSSTTYLQESRWLGGHSWAGLDGISAWIDPNGSGQSVTFRVRTPSADGTGEDWYWELPVALTGSARTVHLPFDEAVATWPSGIASTVRPTPAQLAKVNEFIIMATQADSTATTGSFFLDDIEVGDFPDEPEQVAPVVTTDPADAAGALGATVSLTAAASGTPEPDVQWQRAAAGSSSWVDVADATETTLDVVLTAGEDGARYRAVFTNAAGTVTTQAATVTVQPTAPVVTRQPGSVAGKVGAKVTLTAEATGFPAPSVRWQVRVGTWWVDVPHATSTTFRTVVLPAPVQYRAVFANSAGKVATQAATVSPTPSWWPWPR
jgi:mannan endo-1,4-beta-mannosidase